MVGISLLAGATMTGCGTGAETLRNTMYPPQFQYVDKGAARKPMRTLARSVVTLNRVLRQEPVDQTGRTEVVDALRGMRSAAQDWIVGGGPSNHPVLRDNANQFAADVDHALAAVENEPPNYFYAGSVAGSCMYCHGSAL